MLVYLGIPIAAGDLTRSLCVRTRGADWSEGAVVPKISKVTPAALLFTIVVTFFASAWMARRLGADYSRMVSVEFT